MEGLEKDDNDLKVIKEETQKLKLAKAEQEQHPSRTPHHPLLLDYNYIYENDDNILRKNGENYRKYQGFPEYYFLFKVLTQKYSLEDDYQKYLKGELTLEALHSNWKILINNIVPFFAINKDILKQLWTQEDFQNYFIRYIDFYRNMLDSFASTILEVPIFSLIYANDPSRLLNLIKRNYLENIPLNLYLNPAFVNYIARNIDIDNFYRTLRKIDSQGINYNFIEAHRKFCEEQILGIKNKILPWMQEDYAKSPSTILGKNYHRYKEEFLDIIFAKKDKLTKLVFFRRLTKYYLGELVISALFEATYYNLLVDMETLVIFAKKHKRNIKGLKYYEFLITMEEKPIGDIIKFYQKVKDLNLKEMFYDDWEEQKELFVQELNANLINFKNLSLSYTEEGIPYYDLTNVGNCLLTHTEIPAYIWNDDDLIKVERLKKEIMKAHNPCISLSVQDEFHRRCYTLQITTGITLIYGKIKADRVGTIYHEDAFTYGLHDIANPTNIRRLYTLGDLMNETKTYNELVYAINGEPFYPIGLLVNEVTPLMKKASDILGVPLCYRPLDLTKTKKAISYNPKRIRKHYDKDNRVLKI